MLCVFKSGFTNLIPMQEFAKLSLKTLNLSTLIAKLSEHNDFLAGQNQFPEKERNILSKNDKIRNF